MIVLRHKPKFPAVQELSFTCPSGHVTKTVMMPKEGCMMYCEYCRTDFDVRIMHEVKPVLRRIPNPFFNISDKTTIGASIGMWYSIAGVAAAVYLLRKNGEI